MRRGMTEDVRVKEPRIRSTESAVPSVVAGIPGGGRRALYYDMTRDRKDGIVSLHVLKICVNKRQSHQFEFAFP